MSNHILVLGATGACGLEFCHAALQRGHKLTLLVRSPQKLPPEISENANVTVIQGTFEDVAKLEEAAASGAQIFVSFAGPSSRSSGTPVTDAMKRIFPMLIENHYKRALVLGTGSYQAPEDKGGWKWTVTVALVRVIGGSAYQEFKGLGEFVASQDPDQIPWTLFRVPFLNNGEAEPVSAGYTGSGDDGLFLSRKSMVNWVLDEIDEDPVWVGKAPVISN